MNLKRYKELISEDKKANQWNRRFSIPFWDYNWIYLLTMRKVEYLCERSGFYKLLLAVYKMKLRQLSVKTGISIPPNTCSGGVTLYHWGSVIVNETAHLGRYVTLQSDVNVSGGVVIEDNVYVAPGAKILENVHIAEGCIIGANAVVTKNISEPYTTWAGVPARKISDKGYIDRR